MFLIQVQVELNQGNSVCTKRDKETTNDREERENRTTGISITITDHNFLMCHVHSHSGWECGVCKWPSKRKKDKGYQSKRSKKIKRLRNDPNHWSGLEAVESWD